MRHGLDVLVRCFMFVLRHVGWGGFIFFCLDAALCRVVVRSLFIHGLYCITDHNEYVHLSSHCRLLSSLDSSECHISPILLPLLT
jgi:hypothetical protein